MSQWEDNSKDIKSMMEDAVRNVPPGRIIALPTDQPRYDWELLVHHHFRSIYSSLHDGEEYPGGTLLAVHFIEKIVWIFKCCLTGEIREIVHSGPIEDEQSDAR